MYVSNALCQVVTSACITSKILWWVSELHRTSFKCKGQICLLDTVTLLTLKLLGPAAGVNGCLTVTIA